MYPQFGINMYNLVDIIYPFLFSYTINTFTKHKNIDDTKNERPYEENLRADLTGSCC